MTNLVSDLFILLSVHPLWGEDGVALPYQYDGAGMLVGKLRIQKPC